MRKYTRMTWEQWYQLAKEYYENYHDLRVPGRYQTSQGVELGRWIERQRTAYHGSGKYTIDKHQIYALEQIGMEWGTETAHGLERLVCAGEKVL